MHRTAVGLVATALALAALPAASAQMSNVHVNVAAGATLPNGTFSDYNDVGYNAMIGLNFPQRGPPLGFRVEGIFNEFSVTNFGDRKSRAVGITGNATYDINAPARGGTAGNTLYLIGGVGYYSSRNGFITNVNDTNLGWNIGGGFRFPLTGFSAYAEARYHSITNTDIRFTAISFGLEF